MTEERANVKLTRDVFELLNEHRNEKHMNWDGYLVNLYEEYTNEKQEA